MTDLRMWTLSVLLAASPVTCTAQSVAYTATSVFVPTSLGDGYATASYNGLVTAINPTFGLHTVVFLGQDLDEYPAVWNGITYGTRFNGQGVPFKPTAPPHNPPFVASAAWGACTGQVVGYSQLNQSFAGSGSGSILQAPWHAVLWGSSGEAPVDLHNSNNNSRALACDGGRQVGEADNGPDLSGTYGADFGTSHAVLWLGTARSEVDLHSGPFSSSQANGISGGIQVGWGANTKNVVVWNGPGTPTFEVKAQFKHAVMWTGTPGSIKDMNPAGYQESAFTAIGLANANGIRVGWARPLPDGVAAGSPLTFLQLLAVKHAMVWTSTGVLDLHQFLPPGFYASFALGIDPITNQIVGGALSTSLPQPIPIVWTPLP